MILIRQQSQSTVNVGLQYASQYITHTPNLEKMQEKYINNTQSNYNTQQFPLKWMIGSRYIENMTIVMMLISASLPTRIWYPFSDSVTWIARLYSNKKAPSQLKCQNHLCISLIKPSEGRFQGIFPSLSYSNRTESMAAIVVSAYFGTSLVRHRCVTGSSHNTQVSSIDNSQSNYNMQGVISVRKKSRAF